MVKKLLLILSMLSLSIIPSYASEQITDVDASGVVFVINKQPGDKPVKQTIKVRRSGFIAIVNINGKVEIPTKTDSEKN